VGSPARSGTMPGGLLYRFVACATLRCKREGARTTMPRTDLPIATTKGAASSHAEPDRETSHPIDWRQLSHELRTPLNAILGNVELLLDGSAGPLSAQARTSIGEVQVAGRQLLRQVGLLLAWSELSAGRPKLARQPLDLIALVREASMIECSHPARIEPHDASLLIAGDPFWLQMLLTQIVALQGAPGTPLLVRLERHAGGSALGFVWSGFRADRTGDLRLALIQGLARMQGAALAQNADCLTLHWPGGST
jgi:His Kinase A (phospho-acceptor) domain